MWVGAAIPAETLPSSRQEKVLSVALPSNAGLEEGASVVSSVATKSAHTVSISDVFVVIVLVIGKGSVVVALQFLAITLQLSALALRSLLFLASEAVLRPSSLVLR